MKTLVETMVQNSRKKLKWLDVVKSNSKDVNISFYLKSMLYGYK